ncbi:ABC transporter permease [Paraburkholderia dipogonis]|uniref:ABC transporter permease n=1 Tax=Paraburkholderia dipogonis TaxID=1211383 RepID=A0A4Y8MHE1_9BURK|nr:ABC transporter permease [Paraburkholderia dipogonis]TFE36803.1 ABC transporter permease [Paraburkholderia dipogonis]
MKNRAFTGQAPETTHFSIARHLGTVVRTLGIAGVFIVICAFFSVSNDVFLTWDNWVNLLRQSAINAVLALGATYVILAGGIDLSVGSVMAISGMVAGSLITTSSMQAGFIAGVVSPGSVLHSIPAAIFAGLATGIVLGAVNGLLVARLRLPPFVTTLGMLSMARGMTLIYSDGRPVSDLPDAFVWIGAGSVGGIPVPVLIVAAVFAVAWVVLRYTPYGRYVYAVGGSERAAKTSGVSTRTVIALTYVISGALAGMAGLILTARTTAALPQAGVGYELDAIAAVVIGGTSLSGGRGTLFGTLVGALIIATINNGMDLMGVSSYYQQLLKGAIIVLAVAVDRLRK